MNYQVIKNTEWKEVEINGKNKLIPNNWEVNPIKKISKVSTGNTPSTKEAGFWHESEGTKWISTPDFRISKNGYIASNSRFLTEAGVKKSRICPKDSLLVSCIATVGEVGLLKEPSAFNQQINAILPNDKVSTKYLKYFFIFDKQNFVNYAPESVVKIINKELFEQYNIYYPNNDKQEIISSILSKQESIISNIEKLIEKNEIIFKELSDQLLSGNIRLKDDNGAISIYKNPEDNWKEVEVNGEIERVPSDWNIEQICNCMTLIFGKRILKSNSKGSIPVFGGGNASFYTNIASHKEKWVIARFALSEKCVRFVNNDFWLLDSGFTFETKNNNELFLGYKLFNMQKYIYKVLARGGGQKNIDMKQFNNTEIILPQKNEQSLISSFIKNKEKSIDSLKNLLTKEIEKFEWLLDNLLSGNYLVKEIEK